MNIVLIGMRASGKSTVAVHLARALWKKMVDMDDLVLAHLGMNSVVKVWESIGEPGWREAECQVLDNLLAREDQVIATGGGIVVTPQARDRLNEARKSKKAVVIFLACEPAVLMQRLTGELADRPSLTGGNALDEIEPIAIQRDPWYRQCADHVLDATHLDPKAAAQYILTRFL